MSDLDQLITVTATVSDKAPTRAGFGVPLFAGYHTNWADRVREYAEADDMLDDGFVVTDPLYLMALKAKSQDPAPPRFKIGRLGLPYTQTVTITVENADEGFVHELSIAGTPITYTVLPAATPTTVATALELLIEAVTGIASTSAAEVVTAVSDVGVLNAYTWNRGLGIRETTTDPGIATDLAAIALEDDNWYGLAIDCTADAIVKAAAGWAEAKTKEFIFQSGDYDIVDGGATTDLFSDLKLLAYNRTAGIWHRGIGGTERADAAWLAVMLAPDPGSATPAYKTLAGITADEIRAGEMSAIEAKFGSWYAPIHGINITFEGKAFSGRYLDITRFVDWQVETAQVDVYTVKVNMPKVPFDNIGISLLVGAVEGAINKGQKAGGVAETPAPIVTAPDVEETDIADRAVRTLRTIGATFRLTGAIHRAVVQMNISV